MLTVALRPRSCGEICVNGSCESFGAPCRRVSVRALARYTLPLYDPCPCSAHSSRRARAGSSSSLRSPALGPLDGVTSESGAAPPVHSPMYLPALSSLPGASRLGRAGSVGRLDLDADGGSNGDGTSSVSFDDDHVSAPVLVSPIHPLSGGESKFKKAPARMSSGFSPAVKPKGTAIHPAGLWLPGVDAAAAGAEAKLAPLFNMGSDDGPLPATPSGSHSHPQSPEASPRDDGRRMDADAFVGSILGTPGCVMRRLSSAALYSPRPVTSRRLQPLAAGVPSPM